jgi:hypothetical protein
VIGTIPVGITDDVVDGGGISEPSDVCDQTTDPMSHTPVSKKSYTPRQRLSATNSMVDPNGARVTPAARARRREG